MMIDWAKPIQTRDGRKARFLGELRRGSYPFIVAIDNGEGDEEMLCRADELGGTFLLAFDNGIINVPEEREGWVNIYDHARWVGLNKTREEADNSSIGNRTACIKIKYRVGEGL